MKSIALAAVLALSAIGSVACLAAAGERELQSPADAPAATEDHIDVSTAPLHEGTDAEDEAPQTELAGDADGASRENTDSLGRAVQEAEALYLQAEESYAGGNTARARLLYHQALRIFSSADIDPQIQYTLSEDFGNLFNKLRCMLSGRERTGGEYSIPMDTGNELVQKYLRFYSDGDGRKELQQALERCGMYRAMIQGILREYDLPDELVYLPVIESGYDNNCLSAAGALGIWQLMPQRARSLGLKVNYWIDERKDPEKATRAACRYLKELYQIFDDWHLALAAYNRGEYGLMRDLRSSGATTISEISRYKAVPKETEQFVPQFIACTLVADNPGDHGLAVTPAEPLAYDRVIINRVIDLKIAASCSKSTIGEIRRLNPALKAWCTPYNYAGFELHVPPGAAERFTASIARVKELNPCPGYIKYRVAPGDCLQKIARKFKTTITDICQANNLHETILLHVDQVLVIRPGDEHIE